MGRMAASHKGRPQRQPGSRASRKEKRPAKGPLLAGAPPKTARHEVLCPPRSGGLHHRLAHDELDVAAADADVGELAVAELAELANRVAVAAPGGELLGNGPEGCHCSL